MALAYAGLVVEFMVAAKRIDTEASEKGTDDLTSR